jgi:O-glycosyl hydrolase
VLPSTRTQRSAPYTVRRRTLLAAAVVALLATTFSTAAGADKASGAGTRPVTVSVDGRDAQRIDHFGASGAWWPNDLGEFPPEAQRQVADLLFGKSGIALSGYRYNIGGGGVGVTNPNRAPATFLVAPGHYDWTRDRGGVTFLRLAAQHHVPVIVGFVNSAPPAWTTTGKSCGGQLAPASTGAFASYIADVVDHFRRAEHVDISYVSPMNEPDNSFSSCGQEGMAVPVDARAALVRAVAGALASHDRDTRVIADESSTAFFQFLPQVPKWLDAATLPSVGALAHHTYEFPTDEWLKQVSSLRRFGRPLWMTEICCYDGKGPIVGFGAQYDPTMTSGLWLAHSIFQDLAITGDAAFDWWTAVSKELGCDPTHDPACTRTLNTKGWNDGLLYYDGAFRTDGNHAVTPTKRFFVLGNFSRYVRPGAIRHDVAGAPPGVDVMAFASGRHWVVVATNTTPGRTSLRLALPGSTGRVRATGAVETSATRDLGSVSVPHRDGDRTFVADLAPASVTTFTFDGSR